MSSVSSFSALYTADAYASPVRRPRSRFVVTPAHSPPGRWYVESRDSTRHVMSPMSPLPIRSCAALGRRDDMTPRRVSPSIAFPRAPRGSVGGTSLVGGPLSPRDGIPAQRRYQVPTEYTACAVGIRRAMTPNGRVFPTTVCHGATTPKSVSRPPAANQYLGKTEACLSPTQSLPQQHSILLHPQQPLPRAREQVVGRPSYIIRGIRREDCSFVAPTTKASSIEDPPINQTRGIRIEQTINTPSHTCGGNVNVRRSHTIITHPLREPSYVESVIDTQQQQQHVPQQDRYAQVSAERLSRLTGRFSPLHISLPIHKESTAETPKQLDLNNTLNHELPIQEGIFESPLHKPVTPFSMYSSIHSTTTHRCSVSDVMNKSLPRPGTTMTTTNGSTPVHSSQDCSRSSTETSNAAGNVAFSGASPSDRCVGVSFISSRPLLVQFVLRWRNRCEENKNAYCEGGYMTVIPGKKLNSRYVIVQKLGWGEFSTVWLAYDTMHTTHGKPHQAFVAVKIAKCDYSVSENTQYEVNLLRYIGAQAPQDAPITSLIDCFEVRGQYGFHVCMVMPLHGSNLLSIIDTMKANKRLRSAAEVLLIKEIIASVLVALAELSRMDIIHTDIKPENILSSTPDPKLLGVIEAFCRRNKDRSTMVPHETVHKALSQGDPNHLVCLADFGLSVAMKPSNNNLTKPTVTDSADAAKNRALLNSLIGRKKEFLMRDPGKVINHNGTMIQTREYRAPEILIGLDFNARSDVWSVGCMVYELITGDFLMDPKRRATNERLMDIEHLAMMMQLIGPVPQEIVQLRNSKHPNRPPPRYIHRYFDEHGRFMHAAKYHLHSRRHLDRELEQFLSPSEARSAASFILQCLSCYDPAMRPSAQEMLSHKWLEEVMERPLKC